MSTDNICFYEILWKIDSKLSPNTNLICFFCNPFIGSGLYVRNDQKVLGPTYFWWVCS